MVIAFVIIALVRAMLYVRTAEVEVLLSSAKLIQVIIMDTILVIYAMEQVLVHHAVEMAILAVNLGQVISSVLIA